MPVHHICSRDDSTLDLTNLKSTQIKADTFTDFGHVTKLIISSERITKLPANTFKGLNALKDLTIDRCSELTQIEQNAFVDLKALSKLEINESNIDLEN